MKIKNITVNKAVAAEILPLKLENCVNLDENGIQCLVDCNLQDLERVTIFYYDQPISVNHKGLKMYNAMVLFPEFQTKYNVSFRTDYTLFNEYLKIYLRENLPTESELNELTNLYGVAYWTNLLK